MGHSKRAELIETFYQCTKCEARISIQRLAGWRQGRSHIKTMWCIRCKADRRFVQVDEN